jgi:C_GCAxxG_C_C family probable redox protein
MDHTTPDGQDAATQAARRLFLDDRNLYGCAETTFVVLKAAFGLDDPADPSPAMALNGGVAYGGGTCGAVTGAALAVGMLAGRRITDHRQAKLVARELTAELMDAFRSAHGALDCRDLLGIDLRAPGAHDAFIAGGAWRDRCMVQIEFAVGRMAPLGDPDTWRDAVARIEAAPPRIYGVGIDELPVTPEKILRGLDARQSGLG